MPVSISSGTNTFVPSHEATNGLIVGFSRNPKSFKIANYIQMVEMAKTQGLYATWTSQQESRILDADGHRYDWADGADAPDGHDEQESWQWNPVLTFRRAIPVSLGAKAVQNASWDILLANSKMVAAKAMVLRTMHAYSAFSAAFASVNTSTATALAGGKFDVGTETTPYLKIGLSKASALINLGTLGVVQPNQMMVVCNPNTAYRMSISQEIHAFVKGSTFAQAQLRGDAPNLNGQWGMPDLIYNHPFIVDDAVRVTSNVNATTVTSSYVIPDNELMIVSRVGDLEGIEGSPSFSTLQMFWWQDEMTVESKYDDDNRRYKARVVSDYKFIVPTTASGYRITAATN